MLPMGRTGIFLPLFESAAAAIGAGMIVGGFAGATAGVMYGWSRKQVESHALRDGYIGSISIFGLWLLDLCIVYAT